MAVQYNPGIVTQGLVYYLDVANLKSYPRSGLTCNNLIINNNLTKLVNGITYNNVIPNYFDFDPTDDRIELGEPFSFEKTDSFSFSTWLYFRSSGSKIILNNEVNFVGYSFASLSLCPQINLRNTNTYRIVGTGDVPAGLNTWVNYTMTYNGLGATGITLYTNNVVNNTSRIDSFTIGSMGSTVDPYIGDRRTSSSPSLRFDGRIATFSIYNRTLTNDEVLQNFNALRGRFGI